MNVLTIAMHPDDETLGSGGTLLRCAARGHRLYWMIITAAFEPEFTEAQCRQQAEQVDAISRAYPFESVNWLRFPTTRLDTLPLNELVKAMRKDVEALRPAWVFVPNRSDVHSDHRQVAAACQAVFKPFYLRALGVRRVLACEVLSETEAAPAVPENVFLPNVFFDISDFLQRKLEIVALFRSEAHPEPLPRSLSAIQALARYRGATIGVQHAEAFRLVSEID